MTLVHSTIATICHDMTHPLGTSVLTKIAAVSIVEKAQGTRLHAPATATIMGWRMSGTCSIMLRSHSQVVSTFNLSGSPEPGRPFGRHVR